MIWELNPHKAYEKVEDPGFIPVIRQVRLSGWKIGLNFPVVREIYGYRPNRHKKIVFFSMNLKLRKLKLFIYHFFRNRDL